MTEKPWVDADGTLHETYTVLFLLGHDILAQGQLDPGAAPSLRYRRQGVAYFCPKCGQLWGWIVLVDSSGRQASFDVTTAACEKHDDQWAIPGSFLNNWNLDFLPRSLAKREFMIHYYRFYGRA